MFFIVSTGRSGTQTLARMLSSISGCVCLHEPPPELILESSGFRYGTVNKDDLRQILMASRSPRKDGSIYCESNQTLSLIIPVLTETFPQARYIWLVRNGLDVVASAFSKQWYSGHSENHDRYENCPPLERAWIAGRIDGSRCGDMDPAEWNSLSRFGKCCWYWSYINRTIEDDLDEYASLRFMLVRLEELDSKFGQLVQWMGLNTTILPQAKRYNQGKRTAYHWSCWSADERELFTRWCGAFMDRFYPTWRTATGWRGVEYQSYSGLTAGLKRNYKVIKRINTLFARKQTI